MVTNPSMRFKHALVTGASGIVGVPLCRELVRRGTRVTALTRGTRAVDLAEGVESVRGDVLRESDVVSAAKDVDVVFHLAAAVHGSVSTYAEFEQINVGGTANVVAAARTAGAKLVHVSTVNVDGFRRGELADPYAETKSLAEDLVGEAVRDGLDAVIVRPATVFGNQSGSAGLIVDRLFAGSLKILPAPSRKISAVWSVDLASALVASAESGISGQTYTIAGPTLSTGEFVRQVCEASGLKRPLVSIPAVLFAVPLQLAWWSRYLTRWTPPVSVESLMNGSVHDGTKAARELGFAYTPIDEIFS